MALRLQALFSARTLFLEERGMDFNNIFEGLQGPGSFRFILQPLMGLYFGLRDGKADARDNRPPYFVRLISSSENRIPLLKEGYTAIMRPFALAWVMDTAFQIFYLGHWSPFQAVFVAVLLVAFPYVLVRGLTNRTMTSI
jgi:hypothetical protein